MRMSKKGLVSLTVSEGIVDSPYLDTNNVWTIGVGITKAAGWIDPAEHKDKKFALTDLLDAFHLVLTQYEKAVEQSVKVPLAQHEFDALVHFTYNVGVSGFKRSKLLKLLNAGNKAQAFNEGFHGWLKPASLKSRRDKERAMALRADYGPTTGVLYTASKATQYKPEYVRVIDFAALFKDDRKEEPLKPITPTPLPSVPSAPSNGFWRSLINAIKRLFS